MPHNLCTSHSRVAAWTLSTGQGWFVVFLSGSKILTNTLYTFQQQAVAKPLLFSAALQHRSPVKMLSLSSEILKSLYLNSAESRAALSSSTPSVCCNTHTINHRVYDYRHDAYSNRLASALKGKRALLVALWITECLPSVCKRVCC